MFGNNAFITFLCFAVICCKFGMPEDFCSLSFNERCRRPDYLYDPFPVTSNQLLTRCSEHLVHRQCLIDYENECGKETWNIYGLHADMRTLNKFCEEGSVLFNSLVENGECFSTFPSALIDARLDKCQSNIRSRDPEKYDEIFFVSNGNDDKKKQCFLDIMYVTCFIEAVSEDCGNTAKELVLQALNDNGMNNTMCTNYEDEAKIFMKDMNLSFAPKISLQDFILLQSKLNATENF
ncbi:uncharacterized protein [Parasteatoda tepidariorum]|uniref:uncharacterized protein isoform X1 n=2 Tax=Parasteatoda tepidariorum TaxID=114398 RepID=UPI001C71C05F|nr:uncharacterized protein LOC107454634 [Parasteatoda tepidariorum]